jgi:hypothetical protein
MPAPWGVPLGTLSQATVKFAIRGVAALTILAAAIWSAATYESPASVAKQLRHQLNHLYSLVDTLAMQTHAPHTTGATHAAFPSYHDMGCAIVRTPQENPGADVSMPRNIPTHTPAPRLSGLRAALHAQEPRAPQSLRIRPLHAASVRRLPGSVDNAPYAPAEGTAATDTPVMPTADDQQAAAAYCMHVNSAPLLLVRSGHIAARQNTAWGRLSEPNLSFMPDDDMQQGLLTAPDARGAGHGHTLSLEAAPDRAEATEATAIPDGRHPQSRRACASAAVEATDNSATAGSCQAKRQLCAVEAEAGAPPVDKPATGRSMRVEKGCQRRASGRRKRPTASSCSTDGDTLVSRKPRRMR